jgi:hypothetical protein
MCIPIVACIGGGCEAAGAAAAAATALTVGVISKVIIDNVLGDAGPLLFPAPLEARRNGNNSSSAAGSPSNAAAGAPPPDDDNNRTGGSRNGQKVNLDRREQAQNNINGLKQNRDQLISKPNKTLADRVELKRLRSQILRQEERMRASENHAMRRRGR